MKQLAYLFLGLLCCACASENGADKWQKRRNKILDVKSEVKEIPMEEILIGSLAQPYIHGDFLAVADYKSFDKLVHLFDRQTYEYILSFGEIGQGPTEISSLGTIAWNDRTREFYVTDYGQYRVFAYNVDSLLQNPAYVPSVKLNLKKTIFPFYYVFQNDTLSYGKFVCPTGTSYKETGGIWNMQTGDVKTIDYVHPADKKKRVTFAASPAHNMLVECNRRYDLITLYDKDGAMRYNIYGPNWNEKGDRKKHFDDVAICGDKILASYVGEAWSKHEHPTIIHCFTLTGDYVQTLNIGRKINYFCYDEENNCLIMNLDDEYQFAYLDLKKYL